jgi:hypothetical protein
VPKVGAMAGDSAHPVRLDFTRFMYGGNAPALLVVLINEARNCPGSPGPKQTSRGRRASQWPLRDASHSYKGEVAASTRAFGRPAVKTARLDDWDASLAPSQPYCVTWTRICRVAARSEVRQVPTKPVHSIPPGRHPADASGPRACACIRTVVIYSRARRRSLPRRMLHQLQVSEAAPFPVETK